MPRGGSRPGSGRPKGAVSAKKAAQIEQASSIVDQRGDMSPLEYMLDVMNDPNVEGFRRDRMAVAAAPYVHMKKVEGGKKDDAAGKAKQAGAGKFGQTTAPRLVSSGGKKV